MRRIEQFLTGTATAVLFVCATPALAQDASGVGDAAGGAAPVLTPHLVRGQGAGTIDLPSITDEGLLVGVLQEDASGTRHVLQANLTAFLPESAGETTPMQGGIYGKLIEVGPDGLDTERSSYIHGTWSIDSSDGGVLVATLLTTPEFGGAREIGRIQGKFLLREPNGSTAGKDAKADGSYGSARDAARIRRAYDAAANEKDVKGGDAYTSAREAAQRAFATAAAGDQAAVDALGGPVGFQFVILQGD